LRKLTPISLIESPLGDVFDAALREVPRMDRVRFITHQSKRILLVDLTNCSAADVIERLQHACARQEDLASEAQRLDRRVGDLNEQLEKTQKELNDCNRDRQSVTDKRDWSRTLCSSVKRNRIYRQNELRCREGSTS
jgi:septal ring factor EnvC (AmiA/AmiB activator)